MPQPPAVLADIERATRAIGFDMASDAKFGSLLRSLAASKPKSALLELGTGTGMATAWLLDGMDPDSTLLTLDLDPTVLDRNRSVPLESLGGFLALSSPEAPRITEALAERGVYVDHRGDVLRLGPAPYMTDEQLREAVSLLGELLT